MFRGIIGYEFKKLFIRRNIIILTMLFIFLAFLCWDGIGDYKKIEANKKPFQEMERDKVVRHIHYTAYGTRGIRLLYIPCPLSIIFNDSAVFPGMTAHVDTGEALEISNSFKGKDLFSNSNGFMDFAGVMLLIGCFLALIYGWDCTRNPQYLKFISDISGNDKPGFLITIARIILLNLVFWVLSGISLGWLLINGIDAANIFYLIYVLLLTLVITFFVASGAVIGTLKSKAAQFITMPLLYFLLVLVIPWFIHRAVYIDAKEGIKSIYEFEYQSFKYMIDFEERFYNRHEVWKSGEVAPDEIKALIQSGQELEYKKLREEEMKRMEDIMKRIRVYQTIVSFFPTTFYNSTNKELSSKGFQNFIDFYRYSYDMKQDFIKFYIDRKFYHPLPNGGVEPFIKGNEDLYYGKSHLPQGFILGLVLNLIYIAALLVTLYMKQSKQIKEEKIRTVKIDFSKETPLFALCKDEKIKSDIFRYYREQKTAVCLDKMSVDFYFNSIRADLVLKFLCQLAKANEEKATEYLSILGIKDLKTLKLEGEDILKFYTAVKIAKNGVELIVLNDFFKQKTREFEINCIKLLSSMQDSTEKILYLSCNMFYPKKTLDEIIKLETFCLLPLPIDEVTLR